MKKRFLLLTFDTEEFDLPTEFDMRVPDNVQFETTREGTVVVKELLKKHGLRATFFVTARFAKKYPGLMRTLAKEHEIALHGAAHGDNYRTMPPEDAQRIIAQARKDVERIIKKPVFGFRAPRFEVPALPVIHDAGFAYDSSLHPTYIPGRYNHFFKPRTPYKRGRLTIFPVSVAPITRAPIAWIWFRRLPLLYSTINSKLALWSTGFLHTYFHPWEFISLAQWEKDIPSGIIKGTGAPLIEKFEKYIQWCKKQRCTSTTLADYLRTRHFLR